MKDQQDQKNQKGRIDERKSKQENLSADEMREINESHGDGGNPEWWKNEGDKPGEDR